MSALLERIDSDLKAAMKSGESEKLSTLRLLKSALKYHQIEKKLDALSDADAIPIIQKQIKQRQDAMEGFRQGGRDDLFKKEEAEAAFLKTYLPAQLTAGELETLVKGVIQETGAAGKAQMGQVMKLSIAKAAGRAESKAIQALVSSLLA